jgi:hypothetical protein
MGEAWMMLGSGRRPIAWRLVVSSVLVVAVAGAIVGATPPSGGGSAPRASVRLSAATGPAAPGGAPGVASDPATAACGRTSAATVAQVDEVAARGIYNGELHSRELNADIAHVTGSQALASALASNDTAAVYEAVHAIVYTPHWHIVRLRVLQAGRVVADVGGPDVLAPVSGTLRRQDRKVGSYVMSVQDDAGYVKLVTHFIDVPVDLYRSGSFLIGTLEPAPAKVRPNISIHVRSSTYTVELLHAEAFPSGNLELALFVPSPTRKVSATSCASVRLGAWASIAMHIAARLKPLSSHYEAFVRTLRGTSGGPVFVRSGRRRIAGGASPARIPHSGAVSYAGRTWQVFSWEPAPATRVYFLTPSA